MAATTEPLSDAVGRGTLASRPAAGIAGRLYISTDNATIYRDNGSSWDAVSLTATVAAPTILQFKTNENSGASSLVVTLDATPTVGSRIILGASSLGRDANSVSATNITWTKMGVSNNGTNIYASVWVGVVGASPGTAITISYTGNNFNQAIAIEVPDTLTPTQQASAGNINGSNIVQASGTQLTLAQSVAGRFWAGFLASSNGTVAAGLWANQPSRSVRSSSVHLHVGYCLSAAPLGAGPFMGTTSAAYALYLCTIT